MVNAVSYGETVAIVVEASRKHSPHYICVCNVHMVMEAFDDPAFADVVNGADLVTPDGMPLVWMLRRLGAPDATRVYGPELTLQVCETAAREGIPVGFFGGTDAQLDLLERTLVERLPSIDIVYRHAPPFRPPTPAEDAEVVEGIVASGARIVFVGLGCPKQERWMAEHKDRLPVVMLGVGAAFDFIAGTKSQAPAWMQGLGLEWLFRLLSEPRRLFWRYVKQNPRFLFHAGRQLLLARR